MSAPIRIERDGPLAVMVIDSPPLNLFDQAMIDALTSVVGELCDAPPRGLLIRAENKIVSGGVNVKLFDGLSVEAAGTLWTELLEVIHTVEDFAFPTVFAAHGLCLTAALELSLGCDLLVAAEGAKFGLVETVVGLTPAMGGTQRLAERAGPARAREFVMTGDLYAAATLKEWGVVNQVWPAEGFAEQAHAYAMRLAVGPTRAHAATKAIVRAQKEGGARAADAIVPEQAGGLFGTDDLKNAVRSFLEQGPGKATYEGR